VAKLPPKKTHDHQPKAEPKAMSLDDLMSDIAAQGGPQHGPVDVTAKDQNAAVAEITKTPTKKQMLEELARLYGTTPAEVEKMLVPKNAGPRAVIGEPPVAAVDQPLEDGTVLVPVLLSHDYWAGKQIADQWPLPPDPENGIEGENRFTAGSVVRLPGLEARRLINEGKASRADPLPDEA
jgi:hypothetical protein